MTSRDSRTQHSTVSSLLGAQTVPTAERRLVEAAKDSLEEGDVVLYRKDDGSEEFKPARASRNIQWAVDDVLSPGLTEELRECYREGKVRHIRHTQDTAGLIVPLEGYGVLIARVDEERLDEVDLEAFQRLATLGEEVLARLIGGGNPAEGRQLTESELTWLEWTARFVQALPDLLAGPATRAELERRLCRHVVGYEGVALVAIGDPTLDRNGGPDWTWEGTIPGYLDDLGRETDGTAPVDSGGPSAAAAGAGGSDERLEPASKAVVSGTVECIPDVGRLQNDVEWVQVATHYGIQSAIGIPLQADGTYLGVLAIYGSEPVPETADHERLLESVGRLVGLGIERRVTSEALLAGHGVEVEFSVTNDSCLNLRLAREADSRLIFESIVPEQDGALSSYLVVEAGNRDAVVALEETSVQVRRATLVAETEFGPLVELVLDGTPLEAELVSMGVLPLSVKAAPDGLTATARLPPSLDTGTFTARMRHRYPDFEFRSQQVIQPGTAATDPKTLLSQLSARQREVLQQAHSVGYFESPRRADGEDVAELLDMAPSTFYEHVRAAERNLFAALFESK